MMRRLILSTIGVILTFIWIIYTAPPLKVEAGSNSKDRIKTIKKLGLENSSPVPVTLSTERSSNKIEKLADKLILNTLEIKGDLKSISDTY